jgi:hypothetical protein
MVKAQVIRSEYLFPKGSTFYLSECTNGIINGFHIFVNADGTGFVCNLTKEEANRIFNI